MASKEMEKAFQIEIDEAPYIAKMRKMLERAALFPTKISQILDFLYLGSESDASDVQKLKSLGITHVINMAEGYIHTGKEFYGNMQYLGFDAEDDEGYNVMQHFNEAYKFIEDARTSGGKVLVHCIMGINRSGTMAVAYCMLHKNIGPISAAKYVLKNRSLILTNEDFQRQLITFAREKDLLKLDKDELYS